MHEMFAQPAQKLPEILSIWRPLVRHVSRGKRIQEADMTRQRKPSEILKSIAGGILVGIGLHILLSSVDRAATQMSRSLGANTGEELGLLPSVVLAASQAARVYAVDHLGLLQGVLRMSVSFWPLLLVIVGGVLLRDVFTDKVEALPAPMKYFKNKDAECRFCCPSFDA
jgi:hypothetical protein